MTNAAGLPTRQIWGSHIGLFQRHQPAFWLFMLLLVLSGLYFAIEQLLLATASPTGWMLAWLLMALYVVPVVLIVRWLDLYEREPTSLLIAAFLWGAVVAIAFSSLANTVWATAILGVAGPEFASSWSSALTAPFVEEIYKYLGLVLLYLIARTEWDDLMDGFVYGAMVGLGFTVVEDVWYFVARFGGSIPDVLTGFWVRVIASGLYGHVLYTGLAGVGLAYFVVHRTDRSVWRRIGVAGGLLLLAIAAHFFWNSPWLADLPLFVYTTVKGMPAFIILVVLLRLARGREHRALLSLLEREINRGGVLRDEIEGLQNSRARKAQVKQVQQAAGPEAGHLAKELHRQQIDLALLAARVEPDHADLVRQRALCGVTRARLWTLPGVTQALGISNDVARRVVNVPVDAPWLPNVTVGPQGGWAWATPHFEEPRHAPLAAGLPLKVADESGNWVLVQAANGWSGWTDRRYLDWTFGKVQAGAD